MCWPDSQTAKVVVLLLMSIILGLVTAVVLLVYSGFRHKREPGPSSAVSAESAGDQAPGDQKMVDEIRREGLAPLVTRMRAHGISHENTAKIVLWGSEADVGPDVTVEISSQFLIQEIWDTIYQSRPYTRWAASGYRKADFYAKGEADEPVMTLWINATDACHIDGQAERFRCPKLDLLVMGLLEKEVEKEKQPDLGTSQQDEPESTVRMLCEKDDYYAAMRELPKAMDEWAEYTKRTGRTAEGAAGYLYVTTMAGIANNGDAFWGRILDDPEIPYAYKTEMIFEILEARLGKGAAYVGNRKNFIVPRLRLIDFDTEEKIRLPEQDRIH